MFLALDLGTTSLAGRLLDADGTCLAEKQTLNPQGSFGADVLRRLEAAREGQGAELQSSLVAGINELVIALTDAVGCSPESISSAAAAANPAISVLLQNLSPGPILSPPYRLDSCSGVLLPPTDYALELPVPLYLFPLVNGFVGGDLVAFLFGQPDPDRPTLYIDIGTNGEIALFVDGRWWVTSVAAGPAFEGGEIGSGMLYGPGAIKGCRVENDRFSFDVVEGLSPVGLCGTGLVETIVAALDSGLIDRSGSIVDPAEVVNNLSRHIVARDEGFALQIYRDARSSILLEQKDIRNFQLAKAAVRAGVDCLLAKAGTQNGDIAEVVLTGAFGFSLSKNTLKRVAMLPENMVDKVRFEPGGALAGVCQMLLQEDGQSQVANLAASLKPYPLSGTPAFEKAFMQAINF